MRKFESGIITIVMAVLMAITSLRGVWEMMYYDADLTYDQSIVIAMIFGIIVVYYSIKNIVLRFKNK